jgi:hypothetical protein
MSLFDELKSQIMSRLDEAYIPKKHGPEWIHHPDHAKWKAAQKPAKQAARPAKPIDTSDHKLHKALERHLGGQFEHFDGLRHSHDPAGHPILHARVVHSYTADDLGMRADEMEDTSETHRVKITKHAKGYTVSHHSGVNEEVEQLDELSKDTLQSYKQQAIFDLKGATSRLNAFEPELRSKNPAKDQKTAQKRVRGINAANRQLNKEDVEIGESVLCDTIKSLIEAKLKG